MILLLGKEHIIPNASFTLNAKILCCLPQRLLSGDGEFDGFTVYNGHPYCEACHVPLPLPKCERCKRSIRDHDVAVEALGGKWCWGCFVCAVSRAIL